jgi:hypothetical protein
MVPRLLRPAQLHWSLPTIKKEGRSTATESNESFILPAPEGTCTRSEVERICKPENLVPPRKRTWESEQA